LKGKGKYMRLRNLDLKLKTLLKQGLGPKELAVSISVAILFGVFPIYGTTTIILAFLAIRMRLNMPIMMAVSYLLTPVQILLIIPFVRLGESLFGFETLGMDMETFQNAYAEGISVVFFPIFRSIGIGCRRLVDFCNTFWVLVYVTFISNF
jgi:uncharacterized protein (DUF2062 family)